MSDYKRITMREFAGVTGDNIYNRLAELEDKIESGEIVDRNSYLDRLMAAKDISGMSDKEIEFFAKHNARVRENADAEIARLDAENAELRARLDRAVELPLVQTIRGNKLPYEVAYKDGNGRIIVTKYRRWQKKQAEARLKELQGGER